jgi:hypothetical protein
MAVLGQNQKWSGRQKYSARLVILFHDGIYTNIVLQFKRGAIEMRITVSRE